MSKIEFRTLFFLSLSVIFLTTRCSNRSAEAYKNEIEEWRKQRVEYLKSEDGFLNLAGLYWIDTTLATIGSDNANHIVFPPGSLPNIGSILLENDSVWFITEASNTVYVDGQDHSDTTLVYVDNEVSKNMGYDNLKWFIIKRGDQFGIRLKDLKHPALDSLKYIENYPIDESWKVTAEWLEYESPRIVILKNYLGMDIEYEVNGVLNFEIDDESLSLEPIATGEKDLFIMFYDKSSGVDTYGSGRYLYVTTPVEGKAMIDFNKAFNPPCVYTKFATCLFPHKRNQIPISITAGEKYTGSY